MCISQKAMLVALNVTHWSGRKYDRKASAEVAHLNGADASKAGRYNKALIPVDDPRYKAIITLVNEARAEHYKYTLPWAQDGSRILTAAVFLEYSTRLRELQVQYEQAVEDFLRAYPKLKENAKAVLNGLFRESDYPSVEALRTRYTFSWTPFPIPTAEDFRVQIAEDEKAELRGRIDAEVSAAVEQATQDLYERLRGAVRHVHERLKDPKGIFRDTMVDNLRELLDLLPKLNVNGDEQLEAFRKDCAELVKHDPQTLRDDKDRRKEIAEKADAIAAKMAGFMGI